MCVKVSPLWLKITDKIVLIFYFQMKQTVYMRLMKKQPLKQHNPFNHKQECKQ